MAERDMLRRVLKRITPGRMPKVVNDTLQVVRKNVDADVILGGSAAKGTNLAGDHDIDVFVRFPRKAKNISDTLGKALASLKPERVHGSRDYFHVRRGAYTFEFVPVLKITSWKQAQNVTDMSPLHVAYVKRKLTKRLRSDILLAKQFCKAAGVYGAESYIGGFSGHVVELLTLHYGGFRQLLAAAASWGKRTVLDPERQLRDPERQLNKSKTRAPLVIVDPVDPTRNSAAALAAERYDLFRKRARAYCQKPSQTFFTIRRLVRSAIRRGDVHEVRLVPLKGKHDVVGAKCWKVFEYVKRQLTLHGFSVEEAKWEFRKNRAVLLFGIAESTLSAHQEMLGPPASMKKDAARFREKHAQTFMKCGRVHAREPRRFRTAKALLTHVCTHPYIVQRVRRASLQE